jgi:ribonuclease D
MTPNKNGNKYYTEEDLSQDDVNRLRLSKVIAVDTELTGLNPNRDLLCLVQICDKDGNLNFIKTHDWSKSKNLRDILLDDSITKIFHFAIADCSFFLTQMGIEVKNAYCTKIASKIARTYSPEHSLSSLVKEFLSIELDKTQTSSDWLKDNLTPEQLKYAANDVLWLIQLKENLDGILGRKGLLPTEITYGELNRKCQSFIPILVHLAVNGWDFGREDRKSIFGY